MVYELASIFGNIQVGLHEVEKVLHIRIHNHYTLQCKLVLCGTAQINGNF